MTVRGSQSGSMGVKTSVSADNALGTAGTEAYFRGAVAGAILTGSRFLSQQVSTIIASLP